MDDQDLTTDEKYIVLSAIKCLHNLKYIADIAIRCRENGEMLKILIEEIVKIREALHGKEG
jgi:hypothetical protein